MIIKTVDLITINEASKALKQKDFIYCDGCIYGIDNIDGYITWVEITNSLHDKCINLDGLVFNARELSSFVKSINTEDEFDIRFDSNNMCILSTINERLIITKNDYLVSTIKTKINKINKFINSCNNIDSTVYIKEITNEIQELYSLRKTDGCFYYNTSVNNNKYFMTLFYGLLPLNKADEVSLTIYDTGWIYNDFVTHFVVDKKKFKVNVILCYLKVRG